MTGTSNQPSLQDVLADLADKEKKLKLIMDIDHIRDTVHDPTAMLAAIVNLLAEDFNADLCLLSLLDRESGEIELKAMRKRNAALGNLDQLVDRELTAEVMKLKHVTIWKQAEDPLANRDLPDGSEIAAVPIIMGDNQMLGAMLLVRIASAFSAVEVKRLSMAEDQIDSAVIQGYEYQELQQRNRELETIYRIDHIRDRNLSFEELLNTVLYELQDVLDAEMGFIMLYNNEGQNLEMRASTHEDLFQLSPYVETVQAAAIKALDEGKLICQNNLGDRLRSVMCLPLILNDKIIGVMGVVNRVNGSGFSANERRLLAAVGSQMDTAIFESIEKRHLRQVLGRSVDPRVMDKLLENSETDFLKGERRVVTVLYADIRGSTSLAENTEPELLVGFINDYLGAMTEVVLENQGTLDKFVGDEVMAIFNAPIDQEDHALLAVKAGLAMQRAHREVIQRWLDKGVEASPIGVGIATGDLIVGEMGSKQRTDYTVIGRAANLGARICSAAQAGQVLVSPVTYDLVKDKVEAEGVEGLQFKGVAGRMTVFNIKQVLDA